MLMHPPLVLRFACDLATSAPKSAMRVHGHAVVAVVALRCVIALRTSDAVVVPVVAIAVARVVATFGVAAEGVAIVIAVAEVVAMVIAVAVSVSVAVPVSVADAAMVTFVTGGAAAVSVALVAAVAPATGGVGAVTNARAITVAFSVAAVPEALMLPVEGVPMRVAVAPSVAMRLTVVPPASAKAVFTPGKGCLRIPAVGDRKLFQRRHGCCELIGVDGVGRFGADAVDDRSEPCLGCRAGFRQRPSIAVADDPASVCEVAQFLPMKWAIGRRGPVNEGEKSPFAAGDARIGEGSTELGAHQAINGLEPVSE